jgi:SAM-dependent methyltransferase
MKTRLPAPTPLPHSDACERNKGPILEVLRQEFAGCTQVLEIGSGSGQHAVHFAAALPHVTWQPTEMAAALPGLERRILLEGTKNLRKPVALDVTERWQLPKVDGVFTANTLHILHWPEVEALFANLPSVSQPRTVLAIYGPFRYGGQCTSESNASFDDWLHAQDPDSGIRDFEEVADLARAAGFAFVADHSMPANNQMLIWRSG